MDKRLIHNPDHYSKVLSLYAADTIDVSGAIDLVKYKVNRHDRPIVVENVANNFKVYLSKKTTLSPFTTESKRGGVSAEFLALVSIYHGDVGIKIMPKKWSIIAILFWIILGVIAGYVSGSVLVCTFIAIIFIAAGILLVRGHLKFKASVIRFMNNL